MIALSPFNGSKGRTHAEQRAEALNRVVSILLQGVILHGFQHDQNSFEKFESGMRKVRADFDDAADEDTVLLLAGTAIRLMEEHSREAEQYLASRRNETEAAIAHMSETLWKAAGGASEILVRMKEAERDFSDANRPEELAAARNRLAECVEEMRRASEAKSETREHIPCAQDSVTGLPDSGFAETAFGNVWSHRNDYYVAIFAMERLQAINQRFGFKAGDEVLLILSQHVAQHIRAGDSLFRWRGPCLVALLQRQAQESLITSELARIAGTRLEHAIKMKDRDVMVPVSMSWNLIPLGPIASIDDLVSTLNEFSAHGTRQLR